MAEIVMSGIDLPLIAGIVSAAIFVMSYLPMLSKALRTKDLRSYSPSQLLLTNVGNVVYSAYVFNLPIGPIWALHAFYLTTNALMLLWYVRYTGRSPRRRKSALLGFSLPNGGHRSPYPQ
jgi:uncharacterized protein with PQ loop repeat